MSPSQPQLNISHTGWWLVGDIELLITTNYSHFPPRNEDHDSGSVALVHLVHCVNTHRAQDNYEYSYEMTAATNLDIPGN